MTRRRDVAPYLLTVPETARAMRLSQNELRPLIRDGVVPTIRWHDRGHLLVPVVAIERLIEQKLSAVASSSPDPLSAVAGAGELNGATDGSTATVSGEVHGGQTSVDSSNDAPASSTPNTQATRTRNAAGAGRQKSRPSA